MRAAVIVALVAVTLAACIPMPQRVKDEFSRYDGERPNNFLTDAKSAEPVAEPEAAE